MILPLAAIAPVPVGDPRPATPEKGEALLKAFSDDAVKFLDRVIAWDGKSGGT